MSGCSVKLDHIKWGHNMDKFGHKIKSRCYVLYRQKPESPMWGVGPRYVAIFYCFPRHIIRELDWKWSTWDLNQYPYRMSVLLVKA